ncbi:hypothetical protein C2S51_011257 [Perilla frutescens var. frutescens]|nr:hypothetical protein C2S51_011257 [Perilla frutescens var. frutescens]
MRKITKSTTPCLKNVRRSEESGNVNLPARKLPRITLRACDNQQCNESYLQTHSVEHHKSPFCELTNVAGNSSSSSIREDL